MQQYKVDNVYSDLQKWIRKTAGDINAAFRELSEVQNTITAGAVQTQAGAFSLVLGFNRITGASINDGVALPIPTGGAECIIRNDSGAAIKVWPHSGGAVDDGAVDAADTNTLADNKSRKYIAADGASWYTVSNS